MAVPTKCQKTWMYNILLVSTVVPIYSSEGSVREFNPCADWTWFVSNDFLFSTTAAALIVTAYVKK